MSRGTRCQVRLTTVVSTPDMLLASRNAEVKWMKHDHERAVGAAQLKREHAECSLSMMFADAICDRFVSQ